MHLYNKCTLQCTCKVAVDMSSLTLYAELEDGATVVNVKQGVAYLACSSAGAAALCEPGPIATDGLGGDLTSSVSGAAPDPAAVQCGTCLVCSCLLLCSNAPTNSTTKESQVVCTAAAAAAAAAAAPIGLGASVRGGLCVPPLFQVLACPPQACLDSPGSCSLDDRFIAKGAWVELHSAHSPKR